MTADGTDLTTLRQLMGSVVYQTSWVTRTNSSLMRA